MSLPRYPSYKDSGVEWLGDVPAHWEVKPLKKSFKIVGGSTPKSETESFWDGDILWATPSDLSKRDSVYIDDTQRKITADGLASCGTTLVPAASIILSTRAPIGSLAIAETAMCTNQGCKSLVPSECANTEYFAHLLSISSAELNIRGKGTTFLEISSDELGAFRTPAPPLPEQTQIAAFLDRETAKIDELVAEQRRLMELLKEKRQAVISHAVTQGLNPDAPMKPSGIEWLGDVPAHWDCACLTRIASRIVVGIAEAATHAYASDGVPILRSTNIRPGKIIGDILFVDPAFANDRDSKQLHAGDLVSVRTGNAGVTAVIPPEFDGCQCFTMLITTLDAGSLAEYYCYWMNSISAQCYFSLEGWGTAQVNISVPILKALPVPLPPTSEQREIVAYLDSAIGQFDTLTAEAQRAIDLLQERRTALISAAVTGQIDVRPLLPARKVGTGEKATQEASKLVNLPHENHT